MTELKLKKYLIFLFQTVLIAFLAAVDQFTKIKAEEIFAEKDFTVLKGILSFTYVKNTGAAFGSFSQSTFTLGIFTAVALFVGMVLLFMGKFKGIVKSVCAVMIIAGGLGNDIDRFTRQFVVDFIRVDFVDFPVFNFADILVTCGVFIAIGYLVYDAVTDVKKTKNGEFNE